MFLQNKIRIRIFKTIKDEYHLTNPFQDDNHYLKYEKVRQQPILLKSPDINIKNVISKDQTSDK